MLRIEKVSYTRRNGGSYVLSLSDGSSLQGFDAAALKQFSLCAERELKARELDELKQTDALFRARSIAARYLNYRPRSRQEVRDRLRRAGIAESATARLLRELEEKGDLDDARFAREWVQAKVLGGRSGPRLISKQLAERGVARGLIEEALAAELPSEHKLAAARRLVEKRGAGRDLADARERKRLADHLLRRGFEWDIIETVMKEIIG